MNIDDLFDKMDANPIRTLLTFWLISGLASLAGLALAVLVVVGILHGVGVL